MTGRQSKHILTSQYQPAMKYNNITRRSLIQRFTALFVGSAISPALLGQQVRQTGEEPKVVFIPPGGGMKGKISASDITFKLDQSQTSGLLGSSEMIIPPGQLGAPPHYHKNFDEICIVLEGAVHIMVEDEIYEVKAGGWHLRPRGMVHTFWNSGPGNAKIIELCTPGGHEAYMQDLAKLFENGARPQPADLGKLAERYDIVFRFDKLDGIVKKYKVNL